MINMYMLSGFLLVFLAAGCFGASAIAIKMAYLAGLTPVQLLNWQNCLALGLLWPFTLAVYGMPKLTKGQMLLVVKQGLFGNLAISLCYFWAAQRLAISLLTIVMFTYPGLVLLYKIFVHKHAFRVWEICSLMLAFAGCILAVDPANMQAGKVDAVGLLLAMGVSLTYAVLNIQGEKLASELAAPVVTVLTTTISSLGLWLLFSAVLWQAVMPSPVQWKWIGISAVFSTVLPMNLLYWGMPRIGAFYASVISITELPVTLLLAFCLLGEQLTSWQLAGAGLILCGVFMLSSQE